MAMKQGGAGGGKGGGGGGGERGRKMPTKEAKLPTK